MLLFLAACGAPTADTAPNDTAPDDTAPDDTAPPGTVTVGASCDLSDRIGEIALWRGAGRLTLEGKVYDRPDPWIGPPALVTDPCAFHQFSVTSCGTCDEGEVCSFDGVCVPERRVVSVTLTVTSPSGEAVFTGDDVTGDLYGDVGPDDVPYALGLRAGGQSAEVPALEAVPDLDALAVSGEGNSMEPRSVAVTWNPDAAGRVRTVIPINHHAAGPTFTRCEVGGETGGFVVDADMLTPLAVETGLEFQSVEHANTAAVQLDAGCVDVRLGVRSYAYVDWSDGFK